MNRPSLRQGKAVAAMALCFSIPNQLAGQSHAAPTPTKTVGNLIGKWTFPKAIKLPKSNCGTFKATFRLGQRALYEGTASAKWGYSALILSTPNTEPIAATEAMSWRMSTDNTLDPDAGIVSKTVTVRFCKSDWQNSDGDFLAGIKPGLVTVVLGYTYSTGGRSQDDQLNAVIRVTK